MKTIGIAMGLLACAVATSASAQSSPQDPLNPPPPLPTQPRDVADTLTAPVRAPRNALELGVDLGYTQGFGAMVSDPRVGAGAGGTVGVSLDDRIDPRWSIGVSGQYQGYGSSGRLGSTATLRGATGGLHGTYHFMPYERLDPHLTFGAGYRLFVESPQGDAPSTLTHGLELGKVEVGLDVRPSENVAISPVLGVDVDLFRWRTGGPEDTGLPSNGGVSTFVFAGLKGRFDLGGSRESKPLP
jgi:hypothetical protein